MSFLRSLMIRFGLADLNAERAPIAVFLLDDDRRRHRWFEKRLEGDEIAIAETVGEARELLEENSYDAIFLDHDLLPHHYESDSHGDAANMPSRSEKGPSTESFMSSRSAPGERVATSRTARLYAEKS